MKTYIVTIILIGVIGSIITVLSPDGEGGGLGKHTRLAVGLCIILVCITPLTSLINNLKEFDVNDLIPEIGAEESLEYESIFQSSYEQSEIESLRSGIAKILYDKYGIEPSDCLVKVKVTEDEIGKRRLEQIFINLYGAAVWKDTGEIEGYLSSLFGCETVTAVG